MKMSTYRTLWTLFAIFILTPAFILSSNVEGLSFGEARLAMVNDLMGFYFPQMLATLLSFPVTLMATLIPGSTALSTAFGNFIWPWIGPMTVLMFLVSIDPPGYKREAN
jgi:hypothetical protein